jgi:hypothetical protein
VSAAHQHQGQGYETRDAEARPLFLYGLGLALLVAAALAVSAWVSRGMSEDIRAGEQPDPLAELQRPIEGPVLQVLPARELEKQRAREQRLLTATEWIDPLNQVVRIPLERAMELVLEEGFPVRTEAGK